MMVYVGWFDVGCLVLDSGGWRVDIGCWMQDAGWLILVAGLWILDSKFSQYEDQGRNVDT